MMDGEVMSDNSFFKPTLLYKEFMILDLIEKDANITQREISKTIGVAVSMVNQYIENFVEKRFIKKKKHSTKTVEYFITKKGVERKKVLNISYLNASLNIYKSAKENIVEFLDQIIAKGYKNILLYGAGEVAEILLQTILIDSQIPINVLAIVDDDKAKQGKTLVSSDIINSSRINDYKFDGILISSYTNQKLIFDKLLAMNYSKETILQFFD
jgi:DNA-binding MarR family transcriptional regulator